MTFETKVKAFIAVDGDEGFDVWLPVVIEEVSEDQISVEIAPEGTDITIAVTNTVCDMVVSSDFTKEELDRVRRQAIKEYHEATIGNE